MINKVNKVSMTIIKQRKSRPPHIIKDKNQEGTSFIICQQKDNFEHFPN